MRTTITINTPNSEYEYAIGQKAGQETQTLQEMIDWAKREHPGWTSMVVTIVKV